MNYFDLQIDFFVPLWRRVALVVFCFAWAAVEFLSGAPFWGMIFGGMGAYAAWQLFFCGWPTEQTKSGSDDSPSES